MVTFPEPASNHIHAHAQKQGGGGGQDSLPAVLHTVDRPTKPTMNVQGIRKEYV